MMVMNEEELIDVVSSLRICRDFEKRNDIKLFKRNYKKVLSNLEEEIEKRREVNLKKRVNNNEKKLVKFDKKLAKMDKKLDKILDEDGEKK